MSVSTQSSGKRRLILDLRFVNQFIVKQKVKFEDYKTALDLFQYGGYACSFDLKSGYHHVDIFPSHQRFLGFSWTFPDGRTRYFAFTVLPFGLSSAPYLFTKLMRPLVKYWRSRGLYCIVYLDDGFLMDSTLEKTQRASHLVYGDLVASGFVINQEKSIWCPVQSIVWLGIVWNFEHGTIAVTDARIAKIEEKLSFILQKKLVSTRELASVTGSVISLSPVFGNLSRIMSRHCQISIAASPGWDSFSELDPYCIAELQFWLSSIKKYNSKNCFLSLSHNQIVYSDASGFACGAIILNNDKQICHRSFTQEKRVLSSTHRELIAIEYSLQAFGPILCNSRVKWFTDSQSSVRIVEVGSMQFPLHALAISIFEFCIRNNIELSVQWIPRSLNQKADSVSKFMDIDDWQITSEFFALLEYYWGPHTIDCFANFYNTKIERFFSRFWNPGTAGVDAFFQSWQNENCLLVPPLLSFVKPSSAWIQIPLLELWSSLIGPLQLFGRCYGDIIRMLLKLFLVIKVKMSLSMEEMSILYLVPQTGRGTFMPSDLIFANRSLLVLTGSRLECFLAGGLTESRLWSSYHVLNPWAHREQGLLLSSSVITC